MTADALGMTGGVGMVLGWSARMRRRLPIGAEPGADGVHFRVWAPSGRKLEVVLEEGGRAFALEPEPGGYFSGLVPRVWAGALYRLALDGGERLPDPVSRFQPQGPHGPSEV